MMIKYKFCPICSGRLKNKFCHGLKRLVCSKCQFVFYQNSKPTVLVIITRGQKILLVKRALPPRLNYWDLPGGFLEKGEDPVKGLKREIKEELGIEIFKIKLLGIYLDDYHWQGVNEKTLNFGYLAEIKKGEIKPTDDVAGARWFAKEKLPKKLAFKNNLEALRDWKKLFKNK